MEELNIIEELSIIVDSLKEQFYYSYQNSRDPMPTVYLNEKTEQIIIEVQLRMYMRLSNLMDVMEEFKYINSNYMNGFNCLFDVFIHEGKPILYCTYERD